MPSPRRIFFDRWGHLYVGWGVALGILAVAAVFAAIVGIVWAVDSKSCSQAAEGLRVDHRYKFWAGCQFRLPDGRWIDSDAYRVVVRGGA